MAPLEHTYPPSLAITGGVFTAGGHAASNFTILQGCENSRLNGNGDGYPLQRPVPGDLNHDGVVDADDLVLLMERWTPSPSSNEAAIGHRSAMWEELLSVLHHWGWTDS